MRITSASRQARVAPLASFGGASARRIASAFVGALVSLVTVAPGRALADGPYALDVVLSCPEGANPPSDPHNPQIPHCTTESCACKVYWANRGGALTHVRFTIAGDELPTVPYFDATKDPNGNLAWAAGYGGLPILTTSTWNVENRSGTVDENHTVIKRGAIGWTSNNWASINGYTFGFHQPLDPALGYSGTYADKADIGVGTTGEFAITLAPPAAYGRVDSGKVTLYVTSDQGTVATPQVAYLDTVPNLGPLDNRVGWATALVTNPYHSEGFFSVTDHGPQVNVEHWAYLPYFDGTSVKADDAYDPSNPNHRIILDLTHLVANATFNYTAASYTVRLDAQVSSDLAAPDTGPNADTVLRVVPGTNKLLLRTGFLTSWQGASLDFSAPLANDFRYLAVAGNQLPQRRCTKSDQSPTVACGDNPLVFIALPTWSGSWFWFHHYNSHADGMWGQWAMEESGALRADRQVKGFLDSSLGSLTALTDLDELDLVYEVGGSVANGRDIALDRFAIRDVSDATMWHAPHEIWVTTTPGDYGHEANLTDRTLPAGSDEVWVLCDESDGSFPAVCDDAALTGASFTMADVTHVRIHFPFVPQAPTGGSPANNLRTEFSGVALPTARSSIDGSSPSTTDMTHASTGVVVDARLVVGDSIIEGKLARIIEVDPRPRVHLFQIDAGYWAEQPDGHTFDAGTKPLNDPFHVGCLVGNSGEAATHAPWTYEITAPQGFEPDADPMTTLLVRQYPGNLPVPESAFERTWDPVSRKLTVVWHGPDPAYGSQSTEATFESIYVAMVGHFVQGAPEATSMTCKTTLAYDDMDGVVQTRVWTTHNAYHLSNVFPALQVTAATDRPAVERHGEFDLATAVEDEVFSDVTGQPINGGATAGADEVAVFYRVNRDGDFPESVERGTIALSFVAARSSEVGDVWVSTVESPTRTARNGLAAAGWTLCATNPAPCDATALAGLGVTPSAVRWVVFGYPRVEMTDAAPRSPTPGPGVGHVDAPYRGTVTLADEGSVGSGGELPRVRAFLEVRSADTASPAIATDVDVVVRTDCDASIPGVGFDEPEICDTLDNDCDGQINEGVTRAIDCPGLCPLTATETCDATGAWVGGGCAGSVSCDDDNPCTDDACGGATCTHTARVGDVCNDDTNCTSDDRCDADGHCAGTPIVCEGSATCGVATCDEATGQCAMTDASCTPLKFYGVVETQSGLGSIECREVPGQAPTCVMDGNYLHIGPPMCGR